MVHEESNETVKRWENGARERGRLPSDSNTKGGSSSEGTEGKSAAAVANEKTSKQKYVAAAATAVGASVAAVASSAIA